MAKCEREKVTISSVTISGLKSGTDYKVELVLSDGKVLDQIYSVAIGEITQDSVPTVTITAEITGDHAG